VGNRTTAALRGWETRREREEAVTVNIEPGERALFERAKGALKGSPSQRLEKFEQYVHDHQGEVWEALQESADEKLEAMIAAREAEPAPVELDGLNANERAVLLALESEPGGLHLTLLAESAFPGNAKRNSWVRNSVRRPLKMGLLVKEAKGTYRLAAPLARAA
jgi:hypothetical protein